MENTVTTYTTLGQLTQYVDALKVEYSLKTIPLEAIMLAILDTENWVSIVLENYYKVSILQNGVKHCKQILKDYSKEGKNLNESQKMERISDTPFALNLNEIFKSIGKTNQSKWESIKIETFFKYVVFEYEDENGFLKKMKSQIGRFSDFTLNIQEVISIPTIDSSIYEYELSPEMGVEDVFQNTCEDICKKNANNIPTKFVDGIEDVMVSLMQKSRNSVLLVGESGVGKTTLVNQLAFLIATKNTPKELWGKTIYSFNPYEFSNNISLVGQFEYKANIFIKKMVSMQNAILFIDDLSTVATLGVHSDNKNGFLNILKPYIIDGSVTVIITTNPKEHLRTIKKDAGLDRAFSTIAIKQPNKENVLKLMKAKQFDAIIDEEVYEMVYEFGVRNFPNLAFPDKGYFILDNCIAQQKYQYFDVLKTQQIEYIKSKQSSKSKRHHKKVDNLILQVEYLLQNPSKTHIGVQEFQSYIKKKYNFDFKGNGISFYPQDLENYLNSKLVGQSTPVKQVVQSLYVNSQRRNIKPTPLSFLFVGTSGVGKTELTKLVSQYLLGDNKLKQIDCSEFGESHNVSKLLGSPAGYVGYGEGGILTNWLSQNPYSVVLFDEVEKAHPSIFNILLQMLDEGHITDGEGIKHDCKNTIIILTSNLGTSLPPQIGLNPTPQSNNIMKEIERFFKPEFLGRLNKIVHFNTLTPNDVVELIKTAFYALLDEYSVDITLTEQMLEEIVSAYNPKQGVRGIKKYIVQQYIEPFFF